VNYVTGPGAFAQHVFVEEIGWAFDAEGAAIHDV
jgi:hypothetical protein